jgi:hypothetical protein
VASETTDESTDSEVAESEVETAVASTGDAEGKSTEDASATDESDYSDLSNNEEAPAEAPKAPAPVTELKPIQKPKKTSGKRQQLNFRFTYASIAIGALGFAAVVGLAVLIGKSLSHGPTQAGASSIDTIRKGPAFPQVLKVNSTKASNNEDETTPPPPAPKAQPKDNGPINIQPVPPAPKPNPPLQQTAFNGRRIVGMQYVWIQSYPDPEDANDAVEVLKKAGIDATAEKGLWLAPSWTSVIGTRAFDHAKNNAEFDKYIASIREVSNTFGATSKFKRFEPRPIGWKEQAH